jgi:hypothetical protein
MCDFMTGDYWPLNLLINLIIISFKVALEMVITP